MPVDEQYRRQVALLVRTLPYVAEEKCLALKGGTAINLFVRDLPCLSVDIDLTYLPVADREGSLREIDAALRRIAGRVETLVTGLPVQTGTLRGDGVVNKLFVRDPSVQIKIEVTPVLRGCVFEPEEREVSNTVERQFGFAAFQVVSFADLYAGKLVAALDCQHPRDLFDVRDLLAREGIDKRLRDAFIVYPISHRLTLSDERTRVSKLTEGFRFLGCGVRLKWEDRYGYGSRIEIPKEVVNDFRWRIKKMLKRRTQLRSLASMLREINSFLRGWASYYRYCIGAKRMLAQLDWYMRHRLWLWMRGKHRRAPMRKLSARWLRPRQLHPGNRAWAKGGVEQHLMAYISVRRFALRWMKSPDFALAFGEPDA